MQPPRGPRRMRRRQANCASMSSKSSPGPCPPPGKHRVTRRPHWLGSLRALTSLEGHDQLRQGLHGRPGLFLIQLRHRPPLLPQRHLVPLMEVCSRALPRSPADSARQRQQHPLHVPSHEVLRCVYRGQVHPVGRPVHDESARIVGQHGQHVELLRPPFIFLQFGTAFFIVMRQYHSHSQPIRFLGLSEDLFDQRHMNYHSFHGLQPHGFIDGNREHIYLKIVIIHHEFRRNINCIGFII
mmetsp:Transcript_15127/g.20784  ORF Transcript_15127/g.20784 Transcript_15127/m.20784 type:complete len:240 (+) Transcript_15127:226-945(+)